jgi:hypothetical protein
MCLKMTHAWRMNGTPISAVRAAQDKYSNGLILHEQLTHHRPGSDVSAPGLPTTSDCYEFFGASGVGR